MDGENNLFDIGDTAILCVDLQKCYYRPPINQLFPKLEENVTKVLAISRYLWFDFNLNLNNLRTTQLKGVKVCLWFMSDRRTSGISLPGFPGGHLYIRGRKTILGFLSPWNVQEKRIRNQSSSRTHLMASLGLDFMSICSKMNQTKIF